MRMKHPEPTFALLVSRLREAYPKFSYLHVVEPRIAGASDRDTLEGESNDFLRAIWKGPSSLRNGSVYMSAGGYTAEEALAKAEENDELVAFGRYFISNVRIIYVHFTPIFQSLSFNPFSLTFLRV